MATWVAPLPSNTVVAGTPGHPTMHNQLVDAITEVRDNVDLNEVGLMAGTAVAQVDSVAATLPDLVTDFNALLAKLRTRGVLAP